MPSTEMMAAAMAAIFGGGWLNQLAKNRGAAQGRQADELARMRDEMRSELAELRGELNEQRRDLIKFRLAYARLKEKVSTLIHLMRAQNDEWEKVALEIENDFSDEDEI